MNRGMGCGVWLWFLISLGRCWGLGRGARETVLGTLGKATVLRIPRELQNLTVRFRAAVWKRDTEDPQSKLVLLKYLDGNYTNYMEERTRFHKLDFSLEILNTSRQDRQLYEYIVSQGSEEKIWQIQLEVYEPVSSLSIQTLGWALANGSCAVALNCTAERGDNVSYSWGGRDAGSAGLCSGHHGVLNLSYPLHNASVACVCTASNPVSRQVLAFNSSQCRYEREGSAGLRTEHLVLMVAMPMVTAVIIAGVVVARRGSAVPTPVPQQERSLAEDDGVRTIYSHVQRVQKQKRPPAAEHHSCTTIYVAATGLPPDTAPAPGTALRPPRTPPTEPPTLQSPGEKPTTVYASVMMPTA